MKAIISTEIELKKQELIKKCSWCWRQTAIYMLIATRAFTALIMLENLFVMLEPPL
jgi:hypothetical protein